MKVKPPGQALCLCQYRTKTLHRIYLQRCRTGFLFQRFPKRRCTNNRTDTGLFTWLPHFFQGAVTHIHLVGLLRTSDQPDAETSCWQHTTSQETSIISSGGIRTRNPSKREAADPHLRLRGHWNRRLPHYWIILYHLRKYLVQEMLQAARCITFLLSWMTA
jgi:hypothetical protein